VSEGAPLGALVRLFLRLGFSGVGGPLVHIALMETEVVERRRWLSKEEFLVLRRLGEGAKFGLLR